MSLPRLSWSSGPVPAVFASLRRGRSALLLGLGAVAAFGFAGCAQQPQQLAAASHGKEYFPSSKYGPISRRVVADGQPVPHGGGQYLVGKPYTVAGQTYYPSERHVVQVGNASWYGDAFHGRLTANGEIYDRDGFTAAHPTLPLPSYARVTNLRNNTSMIVRVNDRGPYASNRIMDVSGGVAQALDFKRTGTAKVKVEYIARASLAGSDDAKLLATLRVDAPAQWPGEPGTEVAEAAPPARVASRASDRAETRGVPPRLAPIEADDDAARTPLASRAPTEPARADAPRVDGGHRQASWPRRARDGRDSPVIAGARRAVPDPHAELARLIEGSRSGARAAGGTRPSRVATNERTPDPTRTGREGSRRAGPDPYGRPTPRSGQGVALPPLRPVEARLARGGGRGGQDQRRVRQAGLRLTASRAD